MLRDQTRVCALIFITWLFGRSDAYPTWMLVSPRHALISGALQGLARNNGNMDFRFLDRSLRTLGTYALSRQPLLPSFLQGITLILWYRMDTAILEVRVHTEISNRVMGEPMYKSLVRLPARAEGAESYTSWGTNAKPRC